MDKPHPLSTYLERTGERQADFARRVPISESYLSLIISRQRGVSLATASRLEKATGGRVKMGDLLNTEEAA